MSEKKDNLKLTVQDINTRMAQMRCLFKDPKLTVIIRMPHLENGDMVVTDEPEELDKVIETILTAKERLKKQ